MFITAKSAMIQHGAHARQMPNTCVVQSLRGGEWVDEVAGRSTDYLAEAWNDAHVIWGRGRIVDVVTRTVIYVG
jgi:hypothetical protein